MDEVFALIQRRRTLGAHLGDEVVVGVWDIEDEQPGVVLLAEVKTPHPVLPPWRTKSTGWTTWRVRCR